MTAPPRTAREAAEEFEYLFSVLNLGGEDGLEGNAGAAEVKGS